MIPTRLEEDRRGLRDFIFLMAEEGSNSIECWIRSVFYPINLTEIYGLNFLKKLKNYCFKRKV